MKIHLPQTLAGFRMRGDPWKAAIKQIWHQRRSEMRLAAVFLGLIFVPSGLLAYWSWRAIQNEKLLSHERLQESYHQFARLAAKEINDELEKAEKSWQASCKELFHPDNELASADLDTLVRHEPLIAACFLLTAPGKVAYPSGVRLREESSPPAGMETEAYVREHEIFDKLAAQGEELEYRAHDLKAAIAAYREIVSTTSTPGLRGTAESSIGRVLMKKGDWRGALATFQRVLAEYPEARDMNDMHLRFLAQYQLAVCLESLGRDRESVETLLDLHQDLLNRSDAITMLQYSYFLEQIQTLAPRLLASSKLGDAEHYRAAFRALAEQNKKRISQRYFLQLLDRRLNKLVIERKHHQSKFRYLSDETESEPYLLAYRMLPDASGAFVAGLFALQIDLPQLRAQLFPAALRNLKFSDQVALAILNETGDYVIGAGAPESQPIAVRHLASPFDFWQVAVYLNENLDNNRMDYSTSLGFWFISVLVSSILLGAYIFIRRARREAHLSQMKSTFVSNVSHELRTPLASIKMLAELLEMQMEGQHADEGRKARNEQYLTIIQRECDRLGRLIENVLDFSRIERGGKEYNFEFEDPVAILGMVLESFRPRAESQGFRFEVAIEEPLPDLRMDADAISQVFLNLLSNAVKYSDEVKHISVQARRVDSSVAFEFTDRGIGLEAAEIPRIFDEFYRVDQRLNSRQQGGMGLGLTLARHIVRAHGGEIQVKSEVGKGSTFTVKLPIPKDSLHAHAAATAGRTPSETAHHLQPIELER